MRDGLPSKKQCIAVCLKDRASRNKPTRPKRRPSAPRKKLPFCPTPPTSPRVQTPRPTPRPTPYCVNSPGSQTDLRCSSTLPFCVLSDGFQPPVNSGGVECKKCINSNVNGGQVCVFKLKNYVGFSCTTSSLKQNIFDILLPSNRILAALILTSHFAEISMVLMF